MQLLICFINDNGVGLVMGVFSLFVGVQTLGNVIIMA